MQRNYGMLIRFTKPELDNLTKKAGKANISREAYCRRILNESQVKEGPRVDTAELIWHIRRCGSNINQILKTANARGFIDAPFLRRSLDELHTVIQRIMDCYSPPED